ncbi:MAG: hypothetical protein U0930_03750 [Pirellulales bacterium]
MIRKFVLIAAACCMLSCGSLCQADTGGAFARRLQQTGGLYHDSSYGGRENVYWSSSNRLFGHRIAARIAWRGSLGHRANLPMLGLRVSRGANGTYVVGRR